MYDVIIVGSGIVGLIQALLLSKETSLRVALIDARLPQKTWSKANYDSRVYALTPASQRLLAKLQVWSTVAESRLAPFTAMQVWESEGKGELAFDHVSLNVPALGYIVEENLLRSALLEKLEDSPSLTLLCPLNVEDLEEQETYIELKVSRPGQDKADEGVERLRTRLLIGADGAESKIRTKAGIALRLQSYDQSSLIAQVETEKPHQQVARQLFLSGSRFPKGPLAFLPLESPYQSSIVWSLDAKAAENFLEMETEEFKQTLAEAFAFRLGAIRAVSKRQQFPLYERHAERYVKNRLALIGDAAHTLHPLAGQGLNLGIADAAALASLMVETLKKDRDFASLATLRRYERARKGDNSVMLGAVKLLKTLFSSDHGGLSLLRSQGLIATNHFPLLKNFFARYAMGSMTE